jgi:hypothetical protein
MYLHALSLRWDIWVMFVQDGPLLETNTSHKPAGSLKFFAHALFRFVRFNSSWSNVTNSRGDTGLNVCLLSGSAASRWTTNSCGDVAFSHAFQFLLSPVSLPFSLAAHSTRLASLEALQCKFNIKINNFNLNKTFRTLVVSDKQINALVRLRFNNCWPLKMWAWEWWAYENDGPHRQHANLNLKTKIICLKNHMSKKSYV